LEIDTIVLKTLGIKGKIHVVRDDLFPFLMGGNKARKMASIIPDIERNKCNAIVTTGGIQSNHCRVAAMACAAKGWKCRLILHGSKEKFTSEKGNALLMRLSGAETEFVNPEDIGPTMDQAMNDFKSSGYNPYYLQGGGHNKPGVIAYINAVQELKNTLKSHLNIDHIFLASGTGSTQAGIIAGCKKAGWEHTIVHGISIARQKQMGINSIKESLSFVYPRPDKFSDDIVFYDEFLFGGYGKSDQQLYNFTVGIFKETGLILDETYSGKSFWGMVNTINKYKLKGNIVFWHTGGLLNLMA